MNAIPDELQDHQLRRTARRRVGMKLGFCTHALVYVLVNGGLFLLQGWRHGFDADFSLFRPHIPLLGWGLGLAIHGIVTFLSLQGSGLREQMLEREMQALRKRAQQQPR